LQVIKIIASGQIENIAPDLLSSVFAKWDDTKKKLITNAYSDYLHFLPSDEQTRDFSGIPFHSVAMLRYPVTIATEVLDLATNASERSWEQVVDTNCREVPSLVNYRMSLPIKMLKLKSEFLADLLTRYVRVYNRLGSPDFTPATVERFSKEMDAV
jgi:hypothetical protein